MRVLYTAIVLVSLCSLRIGAQNSASGQPVRDDTPLKNALIAQVDTFMHAWEKQDAAALQATMAPEFLYVTSLGVSPREGVVAALTHVCTLTSYSLSDIRLVHISADSAALVYKLHQSASCAGHPDPSSMLNTDTLLRRGGKWVFLLTTSTPAQYLIGRATNVQHVSLINDGSPKGDRVWAGGA